WMVTKTLIHTELFQNAPVALTQKKAFLLGYLMTFPDDLSVEFRIGRKGNVFLLHRGVHIDIGMIRIISIDPNALLQNQGNTLLANTLTKMDQFTGLTGNIGN